MNAPGKDRRNSYLWIFLMLGMLGIAALMIVASFETTKSNAAALGLLGLHPPLADEPRPVGPLATYSPGVLHVDIPYHAAQSGRGRLTLEVLNPEGEVAGRLDRNTRVSTGDGSWREEITLEKQLALDDIVWHRLSYRFEYSDSKNSALAGTESISQILRTPVVHVIAQQSYLAGGEAAVRLIVTDTKNDLIAGAGAARIELLAPNQTPQFLYKGRLNDRGTTEAHFRLPARLTGDVQLRYTVDTPIGSTDFTESVRVEDKVSILLTTEKPLYQPGQTIHVRALALDRSNHEAAANRPVTLEVEDSRGNKVFKKISQTDKFGIVSAEFGLADEVNLGTYHLRAVMGEPGTPSTNTAEIALNVEKYVLPKFKVAVDFADKNSKTKRGYQPGDHVTGTVHANYFFGKPVDLAEIAVKASTADVSVFEVAAVQGKTDRDGDFHFDIKLPDYFAGHPLTQGSSRVLIEATVKDSAGHSETRGEPITVSQSPLLLNAIPESGSLVPNLDNQVFLLASYPDGSPASAEIHLQCVGNPDQTVTTDDGGVAAVHVHVNAVVTSLVLDAHDKEGAHAISTIPLQARGGDDQILLRTQHAVYRAGDRIQLQVFSTKTRGTAYIDVVKEGQTILTRDIDFENGQAELTLAATPEMAGTLDVNAYLFGRDARPVGDHRLVFVQPADELKIETSTDAAVYKPGDDARVHFRVTNSRGQGVSAALGLQVVDEAVFALAEKQPGFAKVFFYLEQEALKPRYEIHSIGMPDVVETPEKSGPDQQDLSARALFSATEMVNPNKFETEFGRTLPQAKTVEYSTRYRTTFLKQVHQLSDKFGNVFQQYDASGNVQTLLEQAMRDAGNDSLDSWGTPFRITPLSHNPQTSYFSVQSAGADKKFGSSDDMFAYMQIVRRKIVGQPFSGPSKIESKIEHDRGAFSGRAEIVGIAIDQHGAAISSMMIRVHTISTGANRAVVTDGEGRFRFSALPPGDYQIDAASPGQAIANHIHLDPRDLATLHVYFHDQPSDAAVIVTEATETQIDSAVSETGAAMQQQAVDDLAANGRNFTELTMLARGTVAALPAPKAQMARIPATGASEAVAVNSATIAKDESASPATHLRSYFPEALYINPEIITDSDGRASISIPLADSITTWRMAMLASTAHGALGSATSSIKVFQDFFVDLDLPVTLTQGDRVSIPVAVYNYSGEPGDVALQLQKDNWFSLVDDVSDKNIPVFSNRVGAAQFTFEARRIGKFKLTLSARMKGKADRSDILVREIEVVPNGHELSQVFNGHLETSVQQQLDFPVASIPEASKVYVRLYPGPLSQVIEGMDSLLRMPYGCFEQTSSSTYPNVLALDYMKRTKKLTPEIHAKAEGFIANGYQRLLTFEVHGGGFSWFGQAPANKILTAYGLMEFSDMSKVHDVDPNLISRTQEWLAQQQQPDGSWKPDTSFINEGATNRYNTDVVRITAYIAWSLENTGYQGPAVEHAKQFLEAHSTGKMDTYTLAVLANFAVDYAKDRDFTRQSMQLLLDARTEKDEQAWWGGAETGVYATGASADIETTALAAQALLKWGQASGTARKAMNYITAKKDAAGTWGTTQATIMALRAFLLATEKSSADASGDIEVSLNGKVVEKLALTSANNDLFHQFVLKGVDAKDTNTVELRFDGKGGLAYQIVGDYFLPWDAKPEVEALSIDVAYDRTHLAQDDVATSTATIKNNLPKSANMVMVDLGIPPGFDLLSEDLQTYLEKSAALKSGRLEKFSLTATQAILYFDSIAAGETVTLRFRLRAKYPIRARTFQSRVYEYYDPAVSATARPIQLEVRPR
jgi:hypothetical protein